ncbi:MAG TPA: patatin-like phospholipase family protein [Candidatus Dormibacteraeota bacterium]|nr:patatin-like phospholipase family protein [Candidatus Dormibacteraeota bacterium]
MSNRAKKTDAYRRGTFVLLRWFRRLIVVTAWRWHFRTVTSTPIHRALIDPLLAPLVRKSRRGRYADGPAVPIGLGLALGGGFARGFAHLGVLQVLEENHIPISCIAGTSIGSLLGAAYASGVSLTRMADVCRNIRFKDFARWRISRVGLASNDRLAGLVRDVFNGQTFEDLMVPMAIIATDLCSGDPVRFHTGNLADAIRASCAFPGLFEPVQLGTRCLADGGIVAPVPTQAAREMGAGCVLGVSVSSNNWGSLAPASLIQVVVRAISAAQKHQTASWESFADLILAPDVQSIEWDEFDRAEEAIAAGAAVTRQALPRINSLLEKSNQAAGEVASHGAPAPGYLQEVVL